MKVVKVSSNSVPKLVAGAIAAVIREGEKVEVQAIGAGAANQAIKSIAIARGYLEENEIDLICRPNFIRVMVGDSEKTALQMNVEAFG